MLKRFRLPVSTAILHCPHQQSPPLLATARGSWCCSCLNRLPMGALTTSGEHTPKFPAFQSRKGHIPAGVLPPIVCPPQNSTSQDHSPRPGALTPSCKSNLIAYTKDACCPKATQGCLWPSNRGPRHALGKLSRKRPAVARLAHQNCHCRLLTHIGRTTAAYGCVGGTEAQAHCRQFADVCSFWLRCRQPRCYVAPEMLLGFWGFTCCVETALSSGYSRQAFERATVACQLPQRGTVAGQCHI